MVGHILAQEPTLRHRACRYWHVFQAVRASDAHTTLVEKMIYSVFFAEAGWSGGDRLPRARPLS